MSTFLAWTTAGDVLVVAGFVGIAAGIRIEARARRALRSRVRPP